MTIRKLLDLLLNESVAEYAMTWIFDLNKMKAYLNQQRIRLLKYKAEKKEFLFQYRNLEIFLKRAFEMYNQKLKNGYAIDNSTRNFEKTIKPILIDFYNSIAS